MLNRAGQQWRQAGKKSLSFPWVSLLMETQAPCKRDGQGDLWETGPQPPFSLRGTPLLVISANRCFRHTQCSKCPAPETTQAGFHQGVCLSVQTRGGGGGGQDGGGG